MIDNVSTHGNAYTSDPQYLEFLGPQKTRIYYDWGLRAYVRATIQEPKTPQDRVQPADVDEAMTPDPWEETPTAATMRTKRSERSAEMRMRIIDYLRGHGESHVAGIAEALGYSRSGVRSYLLEFEGACFAYRKEGNAVIWYALGAA